MARVFLSYCEQDRNIAERITRLLEAAGFEVWWDRRIDVGQSSKSMIQEAVENANCMIVLWSRSSIGNDWVIEEAEEGRKRDKLIPILIEPISPPSAFRTVQSADFSRWTGSSDDFEFQRLVSALQKRTDRSEATLTMSAPPPVSAPASRSRPTGVLGAVVRGAAATVRSVIDLMRPSRYQTESVDRSGTEIAADRDDSSRVEPVLLGVAAPREAKPGSSFNARFAAYIASAKTLAQQHLEGLGEKDDRVVTDIAPDREARWRIGAPITIRLTVEHCTIAPAQRDFEWNGQENLASFAVRVDSDAPPGTLQLCFHVFLGTLQIAFIPLGVTISARPTDTKSPEVEVRAPSSAFASYSSKDAEMVTRSLSTLAHWAPALNIFQDCLDLTPNETFKPRLAAEIAARDVFLLFWSRNASASKWVLWEFETARAKPGLNAILPMPLEDPAIAPPPPGFEDKHLRDRFMLAGYGLKKISEISGKTAIGA